MPASLSEAFGPDYSTYPANNNTQKKRKMVNIRTMDIKYQLRNIFLMNQNKKLI